MRWFIPSLVLGLAVALLTLRGEAPAEAPTLEPGPTALRTPMNPRRAPAEPETASRVEEEPLEAALVQRRERVDRLHEALGEASSASQQRLRIHVLGTLGDPRSLEVLAELVAAPLPSAEGSTHDHSPMVEAAITRSMAMEAMERVMLQHRAPESVRRVRAMLDGVLAQRPINPHLVATATAIAVRHSRDVEGERERIAAALPPTASHLAAIEFRRVPPSSTH